MVTPRSPLDDLAEQVAGPGTRVRDPRAFTKFLLDSAQQLDSQFPAPEEDAISRLSREVQLLEQGHVGPDQVSPEARALASQRFDQGPSLNPLQMAADYGRALPSAGRVFGEATLTAAYPLSLAGSGAATIGAEKAGLGPNWQTAAGVVGGLAEGPRAVMGARKVAAPLGGIGNPLAGAGRNIAKSTQKLGKAEAMEAAAVAKAERAALPLGQRVAGAVDRLSPVGVADAQYQPPPQPLPIGIAPNVIPDPYGVDQIKPGLRMSQKIGNAINDEVFDRFGIKKVKADVNASPAIDDHLRILEAGKAQESLVGDRVGALIKKAGFQFDIDGRITTLKQIDPDNWDGPLLSSLVRRMPIYENALGLTGDQRVALREISKTLEPYIKASDDALEILGKERGTAPDIVEGGKYFPRTRDVDPNLRSQIYGNRRGAGGSLKTTRFEQAEEGLQKGIEYLPPEDAARGFIREVTNRVANANTAKYLRQFGETVEDRTNMGLKAKVETLRAKISGRIQTLAVQSTRGKAELRAAKESGVTEAKSAARFQDLANLPVDTAVQQIAKSLGLTQKQVTEYGVRKDLYDIWSAYNQNLRQTTVTLGKNVKPFSATDTGLALERAKGELRVLERIDKKIGKAVDATHRKVDNVTGDVQSRLAKQAIKQEQRAAATGARATDTADELELLRQELADVAGEWEKAKSIAKDTPIGQSAIDIPGLEAYTFPNAFADAVNKELKIIAKAKTGNAWQATNSMMQSTAITADNSWAGIHGLFGMYDDPKAFGIALKINARAMGDENALRQHILSKEIWARKNGLPTPSELAQRGLRLDASAGSVQDIAIPAKIGRLPVIKQTNRMFIHSGVAQKLNWTYDIIEEELRQGQTVDTLRKSGDLDRIVTAMNRGGGLASHGAGGRTGEAVLFAARFLQARIENVANGVMGLRSLELADIPMFPGKYNVKVGFKTPLEQRYARRAMLRMIGAGTMLTVGANEALGEETDFRPIVNGRYNANFMKIRIGERDFSIFGPFDSLARFLVDSSTGVATGNFGQAAGAGRSLVNPVVSLAIDLISGEDAVGNPTPQIQTLRVQDTPELAQAVGQRFVPIAARNVPETIGQAVEGVQSGDPTEVASGALGTAGELAGYKTAPLGFTDVADKETALSYPGRRYANLTDAQKKAIERRLYTKYPEVMMRSIEKQFAEYQFRRLSASEINMLKGDLDDIAQYSANPSLRLKAQDIRKKIATNETKRKSTGGQSTFPTPVYK